MSDNDFNDNANYVGEIVETCTDCHKPIPIESTMFVNYFLVSEGQTIIEQVFCDDDCLYNYLQRNKKESK